ncbi:hypothetical protein Gorai_000908, partial [Gossypium raimondii]|nr:hypothetical protein [Gossypium raimondii]
MANGWIGLDFGMDPLGQ